MPVVPLPAAWSRPTPPPWANHFNQMQKLRGSSDIFQSLLRASNSPEGRGAERQPADKLRLADSVPDASEQRGSITNSPKSALTADSMVNTPLLYATQSSVPAAARLVHNSALQEGGIVEGALPSLQSGIFAKGPLPSAEQAMVAGSEVTEQFEGAAATAAVAPEPFRLDSNRSRGASGQEWREEKQGTEEQEENNAPVLPGAGAELGSERQLRWQCI